MLSLLAPKCFFLYVFTWKYLCHLFRCQKKEAYLHAITADVTEMLLWMMWDDTVMDENLVEKKNCTWRILMPKHHAICETLREVGPRFAGPPGFTSHGCFKRRVYRIKFEREEWYQLKTQRISAFSVSTHTQSLRM